MVKDSRFNAPSQCMNSTLILSFAWDKGPSIRYLGGPPGIQLSCHTFIRHPSPISHVIPLNNHLPPI